MLVVFGAGGRCGLALVRAALRAGLPVRPVVRDDREARALDRVIDVNDVRYADPAHEGSVDQALAGGTALVSALDARCFGHGAPRLDDGASRRVLERAHRLGMAPLVHLCVVGAYRWSPHPLNRRSFRSDRQIRLATHLPWTAIRVSCFHDELIEGHLRPPDGGAPHPVPDSARISPICRAELAERLIARLPSLPRNRTLYVGGPAVWTAEQLRALCPTRPALRRRTAWGALPPGDLSVLAETTRVSLGCRPEISLQQALLAPVPAQVSGPLPMTGPLPPHPADAGGPIAALPELVPPLRRAVHAALLRDLQALGHAPEGLFIDWSAARPDPRQRPIQVYAGRISGLLDVAARGPGGAPVHRGPVSVHWDALGDVLLVWFTRPDGRLPAHLWASLDLGVQRRLRGGPLAPVAG